jgi:hypothetical protein
VRFSKPRSINAISEPSLRKDSSLERLLDLDGSVMAMGGGYWVEISVQKVPATRQKPHGINYSFCLCSPEGERLVGFDNAHRVATGRKPSVKMGSTNDHVHIAGRSRPYAFSDAETLLADFWTEVDKMLKAKGVT